MTDTTPSEDSPTADILSDITSIEGSPDSYRDSSHVDQTNETTFNEATNNDDSVTDEVILNESLSKYGSIRRKRKRDEVHQSDRFVKPKKCKDQQPCGPTTNGSCMVRNKIVISN